MSGSQRARVVLIAAAIAAAWRSAPLSAQEVREIGPKVKRAVEVVTQQSGVIQSRVLKLQEKQEALKKLGDLINEEGTSGGGYEKYPAVTDALKQIYREWEGHLAAETQRMAKASADMDMIVDRLDQIPNLSRAELSLVRETENRLKRRLMQGNNVLDFVEKEAKAHRFGPPSSVAGQITGLELMTKDSYLPEGEFSGGSVTGITVVYNHDSERTHHGELHVKVFRGPATITSGDGAKISADGKVALLDVDNVGPLLFRVVRFTININSDTQSSGYQVKFYPFKTRPTNP